MSEKLSAIERRERVLSGWYGNLPCNAIAASAECGVSNVYRIVRKFSDASFERDEREVELKRCEQFAATIVKLYNEGGSIEQISRQLGLHAREVRAAVYMAIKRGEIVAYSTHRREQTEP